MNAITAPQLPNLRALKTRRFWAAPLIVTAATGHKILAPHIAAIIDSIAPPLPPLVSAFISWLNQGLNLDAPFITVAALALFQWSRNYHWAVMTKEVIMLGFFKNAKSEMIEQVRSEARQEGREEARQEGREEARQEGRKEGRAELIRELKANPEMVHRILNGDHNDPTDET